MEFPYMAAFVGAVLVILQQVLMVSAGRHRARVKLGVGYGNDQDLERKIRRHGNLAENAAVFLVVLSLAEGFSGGGFVTMLLGMLFLAARISHAIAFSSLAGSHCQANGSQIFVLCRMAGALGTAVSGVALGAYLLVLLFS